MFYLFVLTGLLTPTALAQSEEVSLYNEIYTRTLWEGAVNRTERALEPFAVDIVGTVPFTLEESDIDLVLTGRQTEVCHPNDEADFDDSDQFISRPDCDRVFNGVNELIARQQWLRRYIRDMQTTATAYEVPLEEYRSHNQGNVLRRLGSFVSIWSSDIDPIVLSAAPPTEDEFDKEDIEAALDDLYTALNDLIKDTDSKREREQFTAAVWRYRHGLPKEECISDRSNLGNGTPGQMLSARFCDVEAALNKIREDIGDETNFFKGITLHEFTDLNVYVWFRDEDSADKDDQVGLGWLYPIEPILPSLNCDEEHSYAQDEECSEIEAIRLGWYPEELADTDSGKGLCSHPLANQGYLCKPVIVEFCPEEINPEPNTITLSDCRKDEELNPIRYSLESENVCGYGGWRQPTADFDNPGDTSTRDEDLERSQCSNCFIDLICEAPSGDTIDDRLQKEDDGRIEVRVHPADGSFAQYQMIGQLSLAQQKCDLPPDTNIAEDDGQCCAQSYQSYRQACRALKQDGHLDAFAEEDYKLLDIDTCARLWANIECDLSGSQCYETPVENEVAWFNNLRNFVKDNVEGACGDFTNPATEHAKRVSKIVGSIPQICSPDCPAEYRNSIGNNLCALGQCIEQTRREHRRLGGDSPLNGNSQAFPYENGSTLDPNLGALLLSAGKRSTDLPVYRPRRTINLLETTLCQINGHPRLNPPSLCQTNPQRRIGLAASSFGEITTSLRRQHQVSQAARSSLNRLLSGMNSQLGNHFYQQYFTNAIRPFTQFVNNINTLVTELESIEFPTELCPDVPAP